MNYARTKQSIIVTLAASSLVALSGCSDSKDDTKIKTPAFEPDTSYLDDLAADQGIETTPTQEPSTTQAATNNEPEAEKEYNDEEREWVKEDGSKSIYGRARDKGIDIGEQIQNSTQPENGLANTAFDEEYAQAAGFAWDMPEDWRMAVPAAGRFAEMYIQHALGNASIVFSKETNSAAQIKRTLQSTMTDSSLGRSSARVTNKEIMGYKVTVFDIEGTYIDPSAKGTSNGSPFYAIHAVVIELPTTKILIKLWGPQGTVSQSKGKFDAMIEKMYER